MGPQDAEGDVQEAVVGSEAATRRNPASASPDGKGSTSTTAGTEHAKAQIQRGLAGMSAIQLDDLLLYACKSGNLLLVRELLGLSGDRRVNMCEQAFTWACHMGHLPMVRELLALTGDRRVDVHTEHGNALRLAAMCGHVGVVRELLALTGDRRVDVNAGLQRQTALQCATFRERWDVVLELLALTGDRLVRLPVHEALHQDICDVLACGLGDPHSPTTAAAWRAISSSDGMMMHPDTQPRVRESARAGYRVYKWCVRGVVVLRRQKGEHSAGQGPV